MNINHMDAHLGGMRKILALDIHGGHERSSLGNMAYAVTNSLVIGRSDTPNLVHV